MGWFGTILSIIAGLAERVGLARWLHYKAEKKAQDEANAPVSNQEEFDYWNK